MKFIFTFALIALAAADKLGAARERFFQQVASSNPRISVDALSELVKDTALENDWRTDNTINLAKKLHYMGKELAVGFIVHNITTDFDFRDYFHASPVPEWADTTVDDEILWIIEKALKDTFILPKGVTSGVELMDKMNTFYKGISKKVQTGEVCPAQAIAQYNSRPELLPVINVWRSVAELELTTPPTDLALPPGDNSFVKCAKKGVGAVLCLPTCLLFSFGGFLIAVPVSRRIHNALFPSILHNAVGLLQGLQGPTEDEVMAIVDQRYSRYGDRYIRKIYNLSDAL